MKKIILTLVTAIMFASCGTKSTETVTIDSVLVKVDSCKKDTILVKVDSTISKVDSLHVLTTKK